MPISADQHRLKIGQFGAMFAEILKRKGNRFKSKEKYSPFCEWDAFTDFSYRFAVSVFCSLCFLVAVKAVLVCDKQNWFLDEIYNWFSEDVNSGLRLLNDGLNPTIAVWSTTMFGESELLVSTDINDIYDNPLDLLLLMLANDVERNPGPNTDQLITELGKSINTRLDTISSDISSMRNQMREFSIHLEEKEKEINAVAEKTTRLESRLREMSEDNELLDIKLRQDNLIFYGIPEGDRDVNCLKTAIQLLNCCSNGKMWIEDDVANAHRLGRREKESQRPRPLLVKMVRSRDKRQIISSRQFRSALKEEGLSVGDDLTQTQRQKLQQLRDEGSVAYYRGSRLVCRPRDQRGNASVPTSSGADDRNHDTASRGPARDFRDVYNREREQSNSHTLHTPRTPPLHSQGSETESRREGEGGGRASPGVRAANLQGDSASLQRSLPHSGRGRGRGAGRGNSADWHLGDGTASYRHNSTHASASATGVAYDDAEDDASPDLPSRVTGPTTRFQTQRRIADRQTVHDSGGATQGRIDFMFQRTQQ